MVAVPSIGRASQVTPRRAAPEADATRDLYERYARQIYAYCHHQLGNREEAEDAMQSTFLNAFRGFKRGVDPEFESAWLYKIAQNVCLTRQRSSSRRRRVESPGDLDAIQDILPSHEVDSDELIGLPEALQGLPKQQQRALLLREWQGLSYKEIADELALTQAAVETLLFRARRSLAAGLSDDAGKSKSIVSKLRAGTDAGSLIALAQSLLSFGGAKVAATVATVAATSVVASTPTARHAVEHAVAPVKPQHVAPAAHIAKPHAKHSFVATSALTTVAHTSAAASTPVATKPSAKHVHLSYALRPASLPVGHRPHTNATPDATVRPVTPVVPAAPPVEATQPTPAPTPPPAEPVVDLPPAAAAAPTPAANSNSRDATPVVPATGRREDKSNGNDAKGNRSDKHGRRETQTATPATPAAVVPPVPAAPAPATPADPQVPAPAQPAASTPATPAWQPPGNVEKKEAREARKNRGNGQQTPQPAATTVPAPAPPVAPVTPTVTAPVTPVAATPPPAPADDSHDRGDRGHGRRR